MEIEDAAGRRRVFFGNGLRLGLGPDGLQVLPMSSSFPVIAALSLSADGLWVMAPCNGGPPIGLNGRLLGEPTPIWPGDRLAIGSARVIVLDREGQAPEQGRFERAVAAQRVRQPRRERRARRPVFQLRAGPPAPPSLDQLEHAAMLRSEDREPLDLARVVACLIDLVLVVPLVLLAVMAFGSANPYTYVAAVAVFLSYLFACEYLAGHTLGKRLTGLRVVALDGSKPSCNAVAVRTVLRLVDYAPTLYLVGAITMAVTGSRRQRLGDLAAGTIVVDGRIHHMPLDTSGSRRWLVGAVYPAIWLAPALALATVIGYVSPTGLYLSQIRHICAAGARAEAAFGPDPPFWAVDQIETSVIRAEGRVPLPVSATPTEAQLHFAQQSVINWREFIESQVLVNASRSAIAADISSFRDGVHRSNSTLNSLGLAACEQPAGRLTALPSPLYNPPASLRAFVGRHLKRFRLPSGVGPGISGLIADGHGGVWAAAFNEDEREDDALVHLRPGRPTAIVWMPRDHGFPDGLTRARDGTIWFTEAPLYGIRARIGRISHGQVVDYPLPGDENQPSRIVRGSSDELWFLDGGGKLGRFTTKTHRLTTYTLDANPQAQLTGLTRGPAGSIWVTDSEGLIIRITPGGKMTREARTGPQFAGSGLVFAGHDTFWMFVPRGTIERFTVSGSVTKVKLPPPYVVTGDFAPAGDAIWFEMGGGPDRPYAFAHLAPKTRLTVYPLPFIGGQPGAITMSGGSVWFADSARGLERWTTR